MPSFSRFFGPAVLAAGLLVACGDEVSAYPQERPESRPESRPSGAPSKTPQELDMALSHVDKFIAAETEAHRIDKAKNDWRLNLKEPPVAPFNPENDYFWDLKTNKGPIRVRFMAEVAPKHVTSTIYLTRLGFYDGLAFHRVIKGFMAQGGDPRGNGTGGPGYSYDSEVRADVRHDRPYLLSMANTGRPRSDGSQFFLTFVPTPHLDMKHTVFGEIQGEEGRATMKALEAAGSRDGRTQEPLAIETAVITVVPKPKPSEK